MSSIPDIREIRRRTNIIIKNAFFPLLSLTIVLSIFFTGIFTLGIKLFISFNGIFQVFLAICAFSLMRFITSPIIVGVYEWLTRLTNGETPPMHEAFSRFSDIENLLNSQKLLFLLLPLWFAAFSPVIVVLFFMLAGKTGDAYHSAFYIMTAFFVSIKLFSYLFLLPHILISARHIPFFKAVILSFRSMRNNFGSFFRLFTEYVLLVILSVIFFGIPLVYTLPYIFCSAVVYCDTVFEENKIYKYNLFY